MHSFPRFLRLAVLWVTASCLRAGYPAPAEAGFHHCALIYDAPARGPAAFAPYVSLGKDWLFDAFLFLVQRSGRGIPTMTGQTTREDWQYHLDQWFTPGRDLHALEAALAEAAGRLGDPSPRAIILSVPYLHREVRDFGDVDGDGLSEDLSTPTGRQAVLRWYLDSARQRFASAGYRRLSLWGFYYMNETVSTADAAAARLLADEVHSRGLRVLWIPWYRAAGWESWREFGFDVAILQPNYAFVSVHLGSIRRNRLAVAADLAAGAGMGVEIELPMALAEPAGHRLFRHYLRDGAPDRCGYQAAATAYYLGATSVEELAASTDPARRRLYEDLASYVAGRVVPEPDPDVSWTAAGRPVPALGDHRLAEAVPGVSEAECRFEVPRDVATIDIFLHETGDPWRGTALVETLGGDGRWQPGGWALRPCANPHDSRWQAVTVPVLQRASGLRVRLSPATASPSPAVAEITALPPEFGKVHVHRAWCRPYRFDPEPVARYPDSGGELTDGEVAGGFPTGKTVGWIGTSCAVLFDLGTEVPLTGAEAYLQGGGYAAVNWPASAVLLAARDQAPPVLHRGLGALPEGFVWVPAGPPVMDRTRSPHDMDGHLVYAFDPPVVARHVAFQFDPSGWLMLSELRLLSDSRNVAAGLPYTLTPPPTPAASAGPYGDDGRRLTDGVVAERFAPAAVTGWSDPRPRTVEVDLGRTVPLSAVTAWSLGGGHAGIFAPASARFEISEDFQTWRPAGEAARPSLDETARTSVPVPFHASLPAGAAARRVRVTVSGTQGWTMLSEVEVE